MNQVSGWAAPFLSFRGAHGWCWWWGRAGQCPSRSQTRGAWGQSQVRLIPPGVLGRASFPLWSNLLSSKRGQLPPASRDVGRRTQPLPCVPGAQAVAAVAALGSWPTSCRPRTDSSHEGPVGCCLPDRLSFSYLVHFSFGKKYKGKEMVGAEPLTGGSRAPRGAANHRCHLTRT